MIHHLAIRVAELARAEAFYAGTLGLPVVRRWNDDAGKPRSVWLDLGGDAFLAVELADAAGPTRNGFFALAIAAAERQIWRARLAGAGITVERESPYTIYLRDPDGNLVGLSHWPEACAAPPAP